MATGGYGRGGRGAALLHALTQPVRKPGQEDEKKSESTQVKETAEVPAQPPPSRGPLGRGAALSSLLLAKSSSEQSATDSESDASVRTSSSASAPSLPMGRGLAAMQALVKKAGQQQVKLGGRGGIIPQAPAAAAAPPPEPQRSPPRVQPPTAAMEKMTLEGRAPPVRMTGSSGKPLNLSANHIYVKCRNEAVYQYHVSFSPEVDSRGMRFKLVNEHRDVIGFTKAFDGTILYLPKRLDSVDTVFTSKLPTDGSDVRILIRLTKLLEPEACVHLYNIIFKRIMHILEMYQVGRYYYNPNTPAAVPQHKLEVWPGYITAVQEQEGGLMLLLDASHKVLRTETVLDVMKNILNRRQSDFHDEVTKTLVGSIVLTRYNNKTYKVDDILWEKNPKHTFSTSQGNQVSFLDYYKKAYNKNITDLEQPLLLHRPKKKMMPQGKPDKLEVICLVPELCYMTGLTDDMRNDFRVMKDLATHTRVTPAQRQQIMMKYVRSVLSNEKASEELSKWGLQLMEETVPISGRLLPSETIYMRNKKSVANPEADWGRDVTNNPVISAVKLTSWYIVYTKRDAPRARDFVNTLQKVCPPIGIECHPPLDWIELPNDRTETYLGQLKSRISQRVQLFVIIFPTSRDDRYSAVKKLCCADMPVPSQVIISKTIGDQRKIRSVSQKIALQINCKLGGELWALDIPFKLIMVVGIDVYHDSSKGKKQSIAGFVASTNATCTRWYSRVYFQETGQELIDGLKLLFTASLKKFHAINHQFPNKVVVFRDGVSDGQLDTVANYEIQQLESCFTHFGDECQPKLSVVIAQKRINTRIFERSGNQYANPMPGSIVDNTITRRNWYDFFLVSQHVRQGTVSPTHYIVVHDAAGMKPDHMQRLTYKMTHLYYNWPGTVRVPAPCQYAHKLAFLVGQSIHKEPHMDLSDRLFFL